MLLVLLRWRQLDQQLALRRSDVLFDERRGDVGHTHALNRHVSIRIKIVHFSGFVGCGDGHPLGKTAFCLNAVKKGSMSRLDMGVSRLVEPALDRVGEWGI